MGRTAAVKDVGSPVLPSNAELALRLGDEGADIFHGVVVAPPKPYGSHRFAHREQIADLSRAGVVLLVPGAEMHKLDEDTPARRAEAAGDDPVQVGLCHAWEWLSCPR
ncbi:hypothetical protein ACQPZK_17840 [Micromonospora sp. CA-249363]|uniref:hypothetical protein n=1 Tax=Micromonospora sp. CA-249363 TaxID=3239963 RepID=UPI003D8B15F2